ncbi:NlpC/P60 family protein [Sphaerisporangium sp. TRM90804]|uniref:bifunctional WXG100 family type VII secretion target/C40 family peptidase n=1 Tax=Sphaerisporangium sp. TRM90804 TaxID=3031113 RepID=UPI002447A7B8|nr:NlpC/P60 family protein [Sphaerisporangium sp. TRM90804]MDH2425076.1 NlpC/P60 family protein [Sphaerisporangium sp. TRM90804]
MTDMGAVAALDGGSELVALANKAKGDPGAIRALASRWRQAATDTVAPVNALGEAAVKVDVAWRGDSADAFTSYMRRFGRAGEGLRDALTTCAGHMDAAAGTVESAHRNIDAVCGDLLNRVAAYRRDNPEATEDQLRPEIVKQVQHAVTLARGHVDAAEERLATVGADIDKEIKAITPTFADIPAAGDQPFVPGPGHTTQWVPVPEQELRTTTLAGANGGGPAGAVTDGGAYSPSGGGGSGGSGGGYGGGGGQAIPYIPGNGTGSDIVAAAQRKLGRPYVFGADGPLAFDCSGLVNASLNEAGIKIGDNTAAGYQRSGQPITGPPQPGDIVFFGDPASHCGIYIGDGKMIHAPHSGDVVKIGPVAGREPITFRRFT